MSRHLWAGILALASFGCASPPKKPVPVDLAPAREAVRKARDGGASERAPQVLSRAESHLKEAEARQAEPERATCLAGMAVQEADCALRLADLELLARARAEVVPAGPDPAQLAASLKKATDESRRLEERIAVLSRDLELTETEVIRTKAKLQGLETKADATSAIAETQVICRRLLPQRGRTPGLLRCEELLERAEAMVNDKNYGAAVFMALKAQELLRDTRHVSWVDAPSRPPSKKMFSVKVDQANLRKEPSLDAAVVRRLKKGTALEAAAQRGDWLQVTTGGTTGWISRDLVE